MEKNKRVYLSGLKKYHQQVTELILKHLENQKEYISNKSLWNHYEKIISHSRYLQGIIDKAITKMESEIKRDQGQL